MRLTVRNVCSWVYQILSSQIRMRQWCIGQLTQMPQQNHHSATLIELKIVTLDPISSEQIFDQFAKNSATSKLQNCKLVMPQARQNRFVRFLHLQICGVTKAIGSEGTSNLMQRRLKGRLCKQSEIKAGSAQCAVMVLTSSLQSWFLLLSVAIFLPH